jgi:hypothetical protein
MTHHEEEAEVHPPRMVSLCMTHHEKRAEVHPLEDEEAGYDSP